MSEARSWKELCKAARGALANGQRAQARRLTRQATHIAPQREEPWLLLAELSAGPAAQAYYEEGLRINPRSKRAQSGLAGKPEPTQPRVRLAGVLFFAVLAVAVVSVGFAWFQPLTFNGLNFVGAAAAHPFEQALATEIASSTATFTATPTPFADIALLPSATPTPVPTQAVSPTPEVSELRLASLDKYKLELPEDLEPRQRWIEVNLTDQTLSAYEGTKLINKFTISSGRANTPTVTGEFEIWVKVRIQAMSGPGYYLPNVPWVMYFYKDYGIHGTWWHNNFGTPMSAGCVNMTIADAEWMYNWASVGTTVMVHY